MARGQEHSGPYNNISYPRNIVDPILRDTVTVPKNSSIGQSVNQHACLTIKWFAKLYVGSEVGYLRFHLLYTRLLLWRRTYVMHCTNNFYFSPLIFHCWTLCLSGSIRWIQSRTLADALSHQLASGAHKFYWIQESTTQYSKTQIDSLSVLLISTSTRQSASKSDAYLTYQITIR